MKRLAIVGAGGHGRVVADAALTAGWEAITFYDDEWREMRVTGPWQVAGDPAMLGFDGREHDGTVIAIGDNDARLARVRAVNGHGLVTIVHAAAVVSPFASIAAGTVVCAGAVVNPFAVLGLGCIVNTSASIDHDCRVGDAVHVSPGAHVGGGVRIGDASWIGIGASVKHGIAIGARVRVGAGAAVVSDVADGLTVVGVPARPRTR